MEKHPFEAEIVINVEDKKLWGFLDIPENALGLVIFAHGSGSGRHSPRNQYVAKILQEGNIGTLLLDLLTDDEEEQDLITSQYRFNIPLLAGRLTGVSSWIVNQEAAKNLPLGFFGASTGAAAALIAAAGMKQKICAIVSRGGRPDLAGQALTQITAPTLLIVGGSDFAVIDLNRGAFDLLNCPKKLEIIPHATHLFEEHGALEEVAALAKLWFTSHFSKKNYEKEYTAEI